MPASSAAAASGSKEGFAVIDTSIYRCSRFAVGCDWSAGIKQAEGAASFRLSSERRLEAAVDHLVRTALRRHEQVVPLVDRDRAGSTGDDDVGLPAVRHRGTFVGDADSRNPS